jgi:uncharacterized protein (TIGR03437 family)
MVPLPPQLRSAFTASPAAARSVAPFVCRILFLIIGSISLGAGRAQAEVISVNAASYREPVAPGSIAACFGAGLAARVEQATGWPLPIEIAATSVRLIDARQIEHAAPLFFVSPGQINYLVPEGAAIGAAEVVIEYRGEPIARGEVQIAGSSPALFTFAANGHGAPVGLTTYDGILFEALAQQDGSMRPIEPGTIWRPHYLTLFGTGLGRAADLRVRIGSLEVTALYAGPQGAFAGLDQINVALPPGLAGGIVDLWLTAAGRASNSVQLRVQGPAVASNGTLSEADVQTILAQAAARAMQTGLRATIAVVDHEGTVLGVFRMAGAASTTRIGAFDLQTGARARTADPDGLQDVDVPAKFAAISKAGTAAFFSTQGNAFSSRTASFIIQEHFPPRFENQPSGPLFGVQFSQLPCSDIKIPSLPLGLAGDPGGVPIYKNGVAAGGIGVEGDGFYSIDLDPSDFDQSPEEVAAVAGAFGFEAPAPIRGDQILVDGIRLPFTNAAQSGASAPPLSTLPGLIDPDFRIRGAAATRFKTLSLGGVAGRIDDRFHPFRDGSGATRLTSSDVSRIMTQAAQQAARTRAAIRRPLGSPSEINIAVVDAAGDVLGLFSTSDAPIFGFDVSVQKARTAAFFSTATAGARLRAAEGGQLAKFVDAAAADGVRLDGAVALSDRALGFLSRPFFPDGIDFSLAGPFSKPFGVWSPFNNGLQIALVRTAIFNALGGRPVASCADVAGLRNGIQIFAGSVPLYKDGVLVGAIGVSGDGIDQDDLIAAAGSTGFEAPAAMRADQFFVRGVRLPFVKFPRHPNL